MEWYSRNLSKAVLLSLMVGALLWGYGKAALHLAQNRVNASISRFEETDSKQPKPVQPANSKKKSTSNEVDLKVSAPILERDSLPVGPMIEPELIPGTYNQVYAKKPSIPSRFDGSTVRDGQTIGPLEENQIPMLGLIGIPTLIFSLLFVVMWGIISGKIQRIMF